MKFDPQITGVIRTLGPALTIEKSRTLSGSCFATLIP